MLTMSYKNMRVLTTDQLATILDTEPVNLKMNFKNNRARFKEGRHYFVLKGEELRTFKAALSRVEKRHSAVDSKVKTFYSAIELLEAADDATMYVPAPTIGKFANTVTLWTRRGMLRHIKSVNTDAAWAAFERMEDVYFRVLESKQPRLEEAPKATTMMSASSQSTSSARCSLALICA